MNYLNRQFVVIGGGPAGLTAAHQLTKLGYRPVVVEKSHTLGGLARTENHNGYSFDMGGHRFFTKSKLVERIWHEILGDEFLVRPRLSRIYYKQKFFNYPLKPMNAVCGLGFTESVRIILSYLRWKAFPYRTEDTFEQWVTNRFGKRLFEIFFKSYTEKVWGIPCTELKAEWAAQRIKGLTLKTAVFSALFRHGSKIRTLIEEFHYPRLGPGMMWRAAGRRIEEARGQVRLNHDVVRVRREGNRILSMDVACDGRHESIEGTDFISSMPISELVKKLDPPPPPEVLDAASKLSYRDFLTVCLVVNQPTLFPDNWIYVHDSSVKVGRIQNYKNWSPDMVADSSKTSCGLEYFCTEGDSLWRMPDQQLIELGATELDRIGLARRADVEDGCVFRVPKSYPIYDANYRDFLDVIIDYVSGLTNLETIGRNGLHRYNNQDHAMLTGILAVRNMVLGENHDLWQVNSDQDYHEEINLDVRDEGFAGQDTVDLEESTAACANL